MNSDSSLGRQDLGSAFGRSAGLKGRLGSRPAAADKDDDTTDLPDQATAQPPSRAEQVRPRPRPATAGRATNTNYPVHVPSELVEPFNKRRDTEGTSNTLLVFDAIDALVDADQPDPYERLRRAVTTDLVGAAPTSLFQRAPRRVRPGAGVPRTQVMLRMSTENRAVIEDLVEQTGAVDRSHLITVALTAYLKTPQDER
ncbi:hypothetical protein [uncultured Cellulomonas sp.]|uniref:hypothetical protein n=1 Tax=uncultured Cellulomonas sp. TaxID=189682 RepID=UPI0026080831|nr:hypothetical protein [uncultured Cellulomonas sp.]